MSDLSHQIEINGNIYKLPNTINGVFAEKDQEWLFNESKRLLVEKKIALIAHYYSDTLIQKLADESGGFVGDSLAMARFGYESDKETIIIAGVNFMGETAKVLSPHKKIILPVDDSYCSLEQSCSTEEFENFIAANPGREVVVYANTSAEIKALADWVVTSSIAKDLIEYLAEQDKNILFGPDKRLGEYLADVTSADIVYWKGSCAVHDEFNFEGLKTMQGLYPDAAVLAHPEAPLNILKIADVVGSTTQMINAVKDHEAEQFIVATDQGVLYKMKQAAPNKTFVMAPTGGKLSSCKACAHCPWLKSTNINNLYLSLLSGKHEILIDDELVKRAFVPLQRMFDFQSEILPEL